MATMREKTLQPTGVHKSGPFNSTNFTDCCGAAILQGDRSCPCCRRPVIAFLPTDNGRCRMCDKPRSECYC